MPLLSSPGRCAIGAALLVWAVGAAAAGEGARPAMPHTAAPIQRIDINHASRAELKTLPGLSDAEVDRIIAARPYPSKAKLLADKVLPATTYMALQGRIVAGQKDGAAASSGAAKASR
jgi:hypothetical protein